MDMEELSSLSSTNIRHITSLLFEIKCFVNHHIANKQVDTFFRRFYVFIFREKGGEGEREGEKHQCVVNSRPPATGDLACNTSMCPDWELNWQCFGLQAHTQSTELHQPGCKSINSRIFTFCQAVS